MSECNLCRKPKPVRSTTNGLEGAGIACSVHDTPMLRSLARGVLVPSHVIHDHRAACDQY